MSRTYPRYGTGLAIRGINKKSCITRVPITAMNLYGSSAATSHDVSSSIMASFAAKSSNNLNIRLAARVIQVLL